MSQDSPELLDSAVSAGSDDVKRRTDVPMSDADRRVLAELSRPGVPAVAAVEDSPLVAQAAEDDRALPLARPAGGGALDPVFLAPSG